MPLLNGDALAFENDEDYDWEECAYEVAESRGQIVVYPDVDQLQLDIDTDEQYEMYKNRIDRLTDILGRENLITEEAPSKSGLPNRHITLTFECHNFTETERILLQMFLGSDPIREGLNTLRLFAGCAAPTRLFKNKEPHND